MAKKKQELLKTYINNLETWKKVLDTITQKISDKIRDEEIKFTTKNRVKSIESLNAKKTEILKKSPLRPKKIKDLLGIRFIVPFLEDVERVVDIIRELFYVVDVERKSDDLSYREFAYDSVHLEIFLEDRSIEFPDFCKESCEVQIRTILQDAWAEVEHELIYKSNTEFPNDQSIRKKLAALNANLSLSDIIFQEIRDKQKELGIWGHEHFQELQKKAQRISSETFSKYVRDEGKKDKSGGTDKHKTNFEAILIKALEAHGDGNYRRAVYFYSKALELKPPLKIRAIIYNHRGLALCMQNKERRSLKDFENSINCDSGYCNALNNRALVLRRMGLTSEALYNFSRSLELDDNQYEVYYLRAQTYYETHDYKSAINDLTRALDLNPDFEEARLLLKQATKKSRRVERKKS